MVNTHQRTPIENRLRFSLMDDVLLIGGALSAEKVSSSSHQLCQATACCLLSRFAQKSLAEITTDSLASTLTKIYLPSVDLSFLFRLKAFWPNFPESHPRDLSFRTSSTDWRLS